MRSNRNASTSITSRNHAAIKRFRSLQGRQFRDNSGLFVAEGVRFLATALEMRVKVEELLVAPDLLTSPFGQKMVRRLVRDGVRCLEAPPEVFHSVTLTDETQGIAAIFRQDWEPLHSIDPKEGLCWLALSRVQSAGNLGTLIRTSDAVGAAGILCLGGDPDPYDPAVIRATMGAVFAQRYVRATLHELVSWKRRVGALLVGTSPGAETDYQELDYRPPTVLFLGCERKGLSPDEQALCDALVRIPMVGKSDSLNVAVAASVILYEVFNQRRRSEESWAPEAAPPALR